MSVLTQRSTAIAELLKARGETVAVAETSGGGLVSAALLAVPGASAYYLGGGVLYTMDARAALLGISNDDLGGIRSSSEPYAELLARSIRDKLGATWGVAETGAAGPQPNRYGDANGHSCVAVAGPRDAVFTLETGSDAREENMWAFADAALALFEKCLRASS